GGLMFPELLASDVVITTARGVRARSIAEHVIGVTIALARQLPRALRAQVGHEWAQDRLEGTGSGVRGLAGLRMGIVGLGAIGSEVATLAAAVGMRVSATRRRAMLALPSGVEAVWPPERLHELLRTSDVVVLSLPHTPESRQLMGRREVALMKPGAFLIN